MGSSRLLHLGLTVMMMAIVSYHAALRLSDGGSCQRMFTTGRFVSNNWQPYGCQMHEYNYQQTKECFIQRSLTTNTTTRIILFGDSRVRAIYEALLRHMKYDRKAYKKTPLKHVDRHYVHKEAHLEVFYYWRQFMDNSTKQLLEKLKTEVESTIMVTSSGALHYWEEYMGEMGYQETLRIFAHDSYRMTQWLSALPLQGQILWMLQEPVNNPRRTKARRKRVEREKWEKLRKLSNNGMATRELQRYSSIKENTLNSYEEVISYERELSENYQNIKELKNSSKIIDNWTSEMLECVFKKHASEIKEFDQKFSAGSNSITSPEQPPAINLFNSITEKALSGTRSIVWRNIKTIGTIRNWDFRDGVHPGLGTSFHYIQALVNLLCNSYKTSSDATCCVLPSISRLDVGLLTFCPAACCFLLLTFAFSIADHLLHSSTTNTTQRRCVAVVTKWSNFLNRISGNDGKRDLQSSTITGMDQAKHSSPAVGYDMCLHDRRNIATDLQQEQGDVRCSKATYYTKISIKLIIMLGYFVLCDRLDFFMTAMKTFSQLEFWVGLMSFMTVALLWSADCFARKNCTDRQTQMRKKLTIGNAHPSANSVVEKQGDNLLSREMTLEWRGWMQVVILVYHVTGASENLPIYMHIRVLVSAYLFMTGYGHFTRAWTSCSPEGIMRYAQVIFRLNFWTALLCLVMQHRYQFYYFVPLVSFWFSVLYLLLILPPRFTVLQEKGSQRPLADYIRAAFKLMILTGFVTAFEYNEDIFEAAFNVPIWSWMFDLGDDGLREWRFRWMLDRFSMLYGCVFALVQLAWKNLFPETCKKSYWFQTCWILVRVASLIGLCSYVFLLRFCDDKEECNVFHPYITWIPITAYVFFRHLLSSLGLHPSSLFQWMGRISLELFVCQYHILLAADTRALLVLVPASPFANTIVVVLVFLSVSHQVHISTEALLRGLVHQRG